MNDTATISDRSAAPAGNGFLTPAEVAATLRLGKVDGVYALIDSGQLPAVDVSRPGSRRPLWRISPAALDAFVRRRTAGPPAPKPERRRKPARVTEYF